MFPSYHGAVGEMLRFVNLDSGEYSIEHDLRLRAQETYEQCMSRRGPPQKQRALPESAITPRKRGRPRNSDRPVVHTIETPDERCERLADMRERRRLRMASETEEEKSARLVDLRVRTRQKLQAETPEAREKRLKYLRDHQRQRIRTETKEEREKRLLYLRERQKERIRTETAAEREKRLSRSRKYRKRPSLPDQPELNANVRDFVLDRQRERILTETLAEREKRLLYLRERQKARIRTETPEEREKRLSRARKYRKRPSSPEAESNADVRDEVRYVRDARSQPETQRDPLDLHDYQNRAAHILDDEDNAFLTIGRVWSLKPITGVDDKLWLHNQQ